MFRLAANFQHGSELAGFIPFNSCAALNSWSMHSMLLIYSQLCLNRIHWDCRISFDLKKIELMWAQNNRKLRKEDLNKPLTLAIIWLMWIWLGQSWLYCIFILNASSFFGDFKPSVPCIGEKYPMHGSTVRKRTHFTSRKEEGEIPVKWPDSTNRQLYSGGEAYRSQL